MGSCQVGGSVRGSTIAAAMIDRLVHHAEVHALTGDSYRTNNRGIDNLAIHKPENETQQEHKWSASQRAKLP